MKRGTNKFKIIRMRKELTKPTRTDQKFFFAFLCDLNTLGIKNWGTVAQNMLPSEINVEGATVFYFNHNYDFNPLNTC